MFQREGFIFLSSPDAVTPFHLDPEHNFLLQVCGTKTVNMRGPEDKFVLPDEVLETLYARFKHRNLPWRDVFQTTAYVVPPAPGQGLHFPVAVPQWVKNGGEVSVSFSVTFRIKESERRALTYRANARLPTLGLSPRPVGESVLLDRTKQLAIAALSRFKQAITSTGSIGVHQAPRDVAAHVVGEVAVRRDFANHSLPRLDVERAGEGSRKIILRGVRTKVDHRDL